MFESKLGQGGFGVVLKIQDKNGNSYALKIESALCKNPRVLYEYKIYKLLEASGLFPRVFWYHKVLNIFF